MGVLEAVLLKKGVRSDKLWARKLLYRRPFLYLPFTLDVGSLMKSQYLPRERIERLKEARLRELMKRANLVPLWREVFRKHSLDPADFTTQDFENLPVIAKKDIVDEPLDVYTNAALRDASYRDHTSGSTGRPFDFFFDLGAELRSFAICERMLRTAVGGKRSYALSVRSRYKIGFAFSKSKFFRVSSYNSVRHQFEALVALIRGYGSGVILYGFASTFIELARLVEERGLTVRVGAVISTGEHVRPSDRTLIERELHTKFFTNYATRELGWLGYECEHRAMHLNEEWALVEVLDKDDRPAPLDQEGEIVVTPFDNYVMPLVRYKVGDRGTISSAACPCGRTLRTIKLLGRGVEFIELEGRRVSLLDLSAAFDMYASAIRQYQIIQKDVMSFEIKIVPAELFEDVRELLEQKLVHLLHPSVHIDWSVTDEIPEAPSGKALYFIKAR